jgi:hypothetical protein
MQKVYNDNSIDISKGDFERPKNPLPVETDCSKYKQQNIQNKFDSGANPFE